MLELNTAEVLGFTLAGVPVWPIAGAEPNDDGSDNSNDDGDNSDDDAENDDPDGEEDNGENDEKGKNSEAEGKIAAARKQAAKYRTSLKPWKTLEQEFGTPEQIRAKLSGTATNEDVEKVRKEAQGTVSAMQKRLVSATVRSLAAEFADPDDAVRFLDLSSIEVDDDGSIDEDEIQTELEAILDRKPHLRKQTASSTKRRPAPDKSQGSGKGNNGTSKGTLESGAERMKRLMGQK